uniref:NBS-LRR protein n=1 Tax=Helianthus annuus TaxID=4232 RepID=F1C967_HELAN|nr:NBS-LRR protein [Helianthus annuus]
MTTRKEELLKNLHFGHLDSLKSLSHEDALSLFALHALGVENFNSHTTLKSHGEGIVKKCAGLPLALKAIGRLLGTRTNVEDWEDVLNSEIWNLENSDKIVPALRLSYHDLSADLKQLFAYCSLFPKDYLFDKEELVLLWMAEGFLSPSNATKSPERLGHDYFEILLSRSFFQHAPNDESLFIMHDLMNDLAMLVAGEFFLRFDNHMMISTEDLAKYRHMSFSREEYVGYHKFKTLIVFGCERLTKLPESFLKLKRLRHFDIRNTPLLEKLPFGIGELESLQTLTKIIIEEGVGFAINELKGLTNLYGEVSIEGLHKVQCAKHAQEGNLSLKKITGLELQWVDVFDGSRMDTLEEEVLNELKPNSDTLKTLSVVSYGGTQISNWVGDRSFHELVKVSIRGCKKCTSLPPFGLLPSLKRLQIQGMDEVKIIGLELTGNDVNAFRSLEVLTFEDMSGLEGWSTINEGSAAVFTCLKELYVKKCPQLINVSLQALPSLKVLEIDSCGDGVLTSLVQGLHMRCGEVL